MKSRELMKEWEALDLKMDRTEEDNKRYKEIYEWFEDIDNHESGCCYGKPDGPDDVCKECDCNGE